MRALATTQPLTLDQAVATLRWARAYLFAVAFTVLAVGAALQP